MVDVYKAPIALYAEDMETNEIVIQAFAFVRRCRWSAGVWIVFLFLMLSPAATLLAQQDGDPFYVPRVETNRPGLLGRMAATNVSGWGTSTGRFIQATGAGMEALDVSKAGSVTIAESGGRETVIMHSPSGGMMIREPGGGNVTQVSPDSSGGLHIRAPDNTRFYVQPDGTVRGQGRRNRSTQVVASPDGSSVTIFSKGGRVYTIPMPGK